MPETRHELQLRYDHSTGNISVRHFVRTPVEPEEGKVEWITHYEDIPLPPEVLKTVQDALRSHVNQNRQAVGRRARIAARRHEYFAMILPQEVKEGRVKVVDGRVIGQTNAPPREE